MHTHGIVGQKMQVSERHWMALLCAAVILSISAQAVFAQPPAAPGSAPLKIGKVPVAQILQRLGARLERGATDQQITAYMRHFARMDQDEDGQHSWTEYVDKGAYMTPQARAGIFRAADSNVDNVVSKAEYALNRIITDEAKTIVQGMDDDRDGLVERVEFVRHATKLLSDGALAEQVYASLDTNADGGIPIPEYLRIWGRWARGRSRSDATPNRATMRPDGRGSGSRFARVFIMRSDKDGDGRVSQSEFRGSDLGFERMDQDGNGFIKADELSELHQRRTADPQSMRQRLQAGDAQRPSSRRLGPGSGPPSLYGLFERFDRNHDGRLSETEVPVGLWQRLSNRDADRDGTLTREELGQNYERRSAD